MQGVVVGVTTGEDVELVIRQPDTVSYIVEQTVWNSSRV
jgi:hypothetical protein